MGITDLILFPIYVYIFHRIFSRKRKKINNPLLEKYHRQAFWLRVFSTVAFTVFCLYISPSDSNAIYFPEGVNLAHLALKDPTNLKWFFLPAAQYDTSLIATDAFPGYFGSEANFFVMRLVGFFAFFSFGSYIVINLFFSMLAFTGLWRLYLFFYEQYPHLHKKLAIAILFLPTLIFWSSGILKDSICIGMLGWLTYSSFTVFYKRKSVFKNTIIAFIAAFVLLLVKGYILYAYIPFFLLFLVLKNIGKIKNIVFRILVLIMLVLVSVGGFIIVSNRLQSEMGFFAIDKLAESVGTQQTNYINMADLAGSSFSLGVEYDGSVTSLVKMAPAAVVATLFRPFLWESKKLSTLLSSLESLAIMMLTLYVFFKAGPANFIFILFRDPMVLFCFSFSVVFALFVGATTLNFGTLVRYKIPCLPFYVIALFLILDIYNKKKKSKRPPSSVVV